MLRLGGGRSTADLITWSDGRIWLFAKYGTRTRSAACCFRHLLLVYDVLWVMKVSEDGEKIWDMELLFVDATRRDCKQTSSRCFDSMSRKVEIVSC